MEMTVNEVRYHASDAMRAYVNFLNARSKRAQMVTFNDMHIDISDGMF